MQGFSLSLILFILVTFLIDWYACTGLQSLAGKWKFIGKNWFKTAYWCLCIFLLAALLLVVYVKVDFGIRVGILVAFFAAMLCGFSFSVFLLIDDIRRFIVRLKNHSKKPRHPAETNQPSPGAIPRSEFLVKAGLLAGAVPLASFKMVMKSGLYDYQVVRQDVYLPNLPKAFDGLRIGQISDIHSGSFYNKTAVKGGVDMLMREKTDVIFFTGDLVNEFSSDMRNYQDLFSNVKAPLGVFSCTGNHDYGDYYNEWSSAAAKRKNFEQIVATHKIMGWDLLLNENRRLKVGNEEIGILGIENWGALNRFPKYGRMDLAVKNTDDLPVKLLLSHDPSHWRAQVLPHYPQIDMVFAGHTHGMQAGIRTKDFQWSAIEYLYSEWAGLYRQGMQQIYVNVGYGFYGIHGRVGILPEITIFTLKSAAGASANT